MQYLGVDNGVSGALVLLSESGEILSKLIMPIKTTRKGNEVDVVAISQWMQSGCINHLNTVVVIEEPGGSKSARAGASMSGSFHALRALIELGRFRHFRITPQSWQKPMLRCKSGDTKPAALAMARSLWPSEDWLESPRCRVANMGYVDSALIAHHARREKW